MDDIEFDRGMNDTINNIDIMVRTYQISKFIKISIIVAIIIFIFYKLYKKG
jgi:hypothetical protein